MIVAMLLAAAASNAPAPVLHLAEARSVAYRSCIVAEHGRRPALTVAQIGRGRCAAPRAKLFDAAHNHVRYGWRTVPKSAGAVRRLKAQHKINAEAEVVRFEAALQAWLAAQHVAPNG
ncbi:MAG TPA: hypothetical protein VIT45_07710 [Allosphingosinicella sp.]